MFNYWEIDEIKAREIGSTLSSFTFSYFVHPLKTKRIWQFWVELVFVSICHKTNWDILHNGVIKIASNEPESLKPSSLAIMDIEQFNRLFSKWLNRDKNLAKERLDILNSLGRVAKGWIMEDELEWLNHDYVTLSGSNGIYAWLDQFEGFSEDPVRKKARVLIHQLLRYKLIKINDPEHIAPAIDHHIIRLYLRTGRVVPKNNELLDLLIKGVSLEVDMLNDLRYVVEKAMWYSAQSSGLPMNEYNHIEWQIARSFCVTELARCQSIPLPEKPVESGIMSLSEAVGGGCPLKLVCPGAQNVQLKKTVEPYSQVSYY
ncbi:hypothetical protein QM565_27955 [Geitlerinema splendidum]|nr:hypothetical protein [Geitlerinema splendidum]